ncbi:MAG: Type 1 glutamine amidotransferase-like domain-containing protein [Bacteriovoracia bacterium]
MNLIFYSGGNTRENRPLAREVAASLRDKRNPVITFVPADSESANEDFRAFKRSFSRSGIRRFRCIPVDVALSAKNEKLLLSSDAIFLGGGNTFYFLDSLRKRKLLPKLRRFAKNGGLLMGLSAGSILMTPSIMTAAVPAIDSDDNEIGLRNFKALKLVPFEFSPHYYRSREADEELKNYSKQLPHPIYACKDGEGIVVKNGSIHFIGRVAVFRNGAKFRM